VSNFVHTIRMAIRALRRAPGTAASAIIILSVGIGASVAMFTVFRAVLIRRLPVVDQDKLVILSLLSTTGAEMPTIGAEVDQLRRSSVTMRAVAGVSLSGTFTFPLLDGDRPVLPHRSIVSGNFFDVLGARPIIGRLLHEADEAEGTRPQAPTPGDVEPLVISYGAWRRWFGGDGAVVGRRLSDPYGGWSYTIVGVAPPGLDYPRGADYWIPMAKNSGAIVVARLAGNAMPAAARAEFLAMTRGSRPQGQSTIAGATVASLADEILGDVRPALTVLGAAVGLLLLIACVNVGGLLILRASSRGQEMAVRRAIGATYGDLVEQLLAESMVLAAAGGVLGLLSAYVLLHMLIVLTPAQLPRMDLVSIAGAPVGAGVAVTAVAVLLFGITPALLSARGDPARALRFDGRSGSQSSVRRRARQTLVASQIALALVMVAGAALLTRSLERLERVPLGYEPDHLSFIAISFPAKWYYDQVARVFPLGDRVFSRLRAIAGVTALTPVMVPPFTGANVWRWNFETEGQTPAAAADRTIPVEVGDADLLRTLKMRLVRGHGLTEADRDGAALVVMVSESVARQLWPGQDAIGKRIRTDAALPSGSWWRTVVGVVSDLHFRAFREASPTVFLPWRQAWWQGWIALRTSDELTAVLPAMRKSLREMDPLVTVSQEQTMDELLSAPLAEPKLSAFLLSGFGCVALALAAMGLYGMMAAAVRQQTREMGIRMVLGATPIQLRNGVLREALGIVAGGGIVGLAAALGTARLLAAMLFQVSPLDPVALCGACAALVAVGIGAAYLPARRAARIDPAKVLRAE
jgi:putative ABC transport system permease protein